MPGLMVCPLHVDTDVRGVHMGDGEFLFRCPRGSGHPHEPFDWFENDAVVPAGLTGLAAELSLADRLPAAVCQLGGGWYEYGLVEHQFALLNPTEWSTIVRAFTHRKSNDQFHLQPSKYTASAYLAHTLGTLARSGAVALREGAATGYWSYNTTISYWATAADADWATRNTWESVSPSMDYVAAALRP